VSVLTNTPPVSPSELARRLAEYRKLGFEHRAPAQVVYQEPFVVCPWPGCGLRIDGIHFQLDKWLNQSQQDQLMDSWWKGPGLVGRCPKCGQYVLFGIESKTTVKDTSTFANAVLPDTWATESHIVTKTPMEGKSK
jgi:hypothetical protein